MVAFLLFPSAVADRQFYQAGFMAPTYQSTYAAAPEMMYAPEVQYAYPEAYPEESSGFSDMAMLAVAGAALGAAIGYKTKVSTLAVNGREESLADKVKGAMLAVLVTVGLSSPLAANAVDVKLGSDGGQLVFVPDEVTIKAGDSVTWLGNKGMPHNVVFDEENVPDGTALDKINHEDMINDEGEKATSKFDKPGTYAYYCEPHRGAGMNGTIVVK